ncbi:MAG: flavin reductase family protein [Phycisphaeraceae bacterium]
MANPTHPPMDEQQRAAVASTLGAIPSGLYILTAAHEDRRLGVLVGWVQQCCFEPPMVSISIQKGTPIMPLISESRQFGLCQLGTEDGRHIRKFGGQVDLGDDPFLGQQLIKPVLAKLPILAASRSYMECELVCHMDVEGDHDIFVGVLRNAGYTPPFEPKIHLRDDGMSY